MGDRRGQSRLHGLGLFNNVQCLLNAVCAASDCTGVTHCCKKFFLILPGVFPGKFNLDVQGLAVIDPVAPDISLAVITDTDNSAVLGVELTYRMVPGDAAVFTQSSDNLVL